MTAKVPLMKRPSTEEVARSLATIPESSVGEVVSMLPAATLPYFATRVGLIARMAANALKQAEQRIALEEVVKVGGEWVDEETGLIHTFEGAAGDWDCLDPDGFHAALLAVGVSKELADKALPQKRTLNNTLLNSLRDASNNGKDKKVAQVIRDFRSRKKDGPPHLKPKE